MELIDIYDENRQLTGLKTDRRTAFMEKGQYMLYVLALIEDGKGRFLITQRALNKKWAAGAWEIPGGGAQAGETSLQAVQREVREETGLEIRENAAPVYSYANVDEARGDNYFVDIYHFYVNFTEQDVTIERSEAIAYRLASMKEIGEIEASSGFLHYQRILEAFAAEASE